MASRKVLINYHSTKNEAPAVANVYEGELVVSHPSTAISATTIWTKNGDVMVPFASCAMTKIMIDAAVQEASKTVTVTAKTGEKYLKVESGGTEAAKVFTLSTSGVASSTDLTTLSGAAHTKITNLSAGTVSKLTSLTNVVSALTDVVVTGISGDSIIVATKVENGTNSNTYNLTHKGQTAVASGFNKLATDAYGHVTASTAVAASDIEGLGFKDSAWTEEKITAAIEALDSSSAVTTGKYMTGIAIKDGKISGITQADLPKLASATTGNGNVVTDIAVNDHTITFAKDLTVASDQDLKNLSAVTITGVTAAGVAVPVANHVAKIYSASSSNFGVVKTGDFITNTNGTIKVSTGTSSSSVARGDHFAAVSAATTANTQNLNNLSAVTITGVSMNGAEVSVANHVAVLGDVITAETQLEKTVSGNGNVFTDIAVNDHAIVINKGITALTGVSTPNSDKYLSVSVSSNSAITVGEKKAVVADKTTLAGVSATGSLVDAKAVKDYVGDIVSSSVNYKGATGTLPASPSKGDLWIAASAMTASSKSVEIGDFIIYNGSSWDVIEKNLDGAITGNLTANTLTLGNGEHTVKSLANGTNGQVLVMGASSPEWVNGLLTDSATTETGHYTPTTTASTLGSSTAGQFIKTIAIDSKKHAISVTTGTALTDQAAITTGNGSSVSSAAAAVVTGITTGGTKGHTLTLNKTNKIFSASTADEAVKTVSALTVTFADGSDPVVFDGSADKSITIPAVTAVTVVDGTNALDWNTDKTLATINVGGTDYVINAKLPANPNTDTKVTAVANHYTATTATKTGGTTTATDASAIKGITYDAAGHIVGITTGSVLTSFTETQLSYESGASVSNTAAAVVTGLTVSNHKITYGKTNKIHSAQTANSAVCATTAVSAATAANAAKVASALTMTDGTNTQTYDGSAPKTLTFGTATSVTGSKSMSMTSAGVVDVEIIDCGTY